MSGLGCSDELVPVMNNSVGPAVVIASKSTADLPISAAAKDVIGEQWTHLVAVADETVEVVVRRSDCGYAMEIEDTSSIDVVSAAMGAVAKNPTATIKLDRDAARSAGYAGDDTPMLPQRSAYTDDAAGDAAFLAAMERWRLFVAYAAANQQ